MAYRSIGQESLGIAPLTRASSSLDKLSQLIDWRPIATLLEPLYPATKGEPAWRPLAMFKALLLAVWYDLSDGKLAEALDDRASFRCFCGFSSGEATPERTAFVRYRKALIVHGLDHRLFETVTAELKAKAVRVKMGTLVGATIIASASEVDDNGRWVKHKGRAAVHGFKAHVGADANTALIEKVSVTPANVNDGRAGPDALPDDPGAMCLPTVPIGACTSAIRFGPRAARHASARPRCGAATSRKHSPGSMPGTRRSIAYAPGSKRPSARGSAARVCTGCDGEASPKPLPKYTSQPPPTTSSAHSISSRRNNRSIHRSRKLTALSDKQSAYLSAISTIYTHPRTGLITDQPMPPPLRPSPGSTIEAVQGVVSRPVV